MKGKIAEKIVDFKGLRPSPGDVLVIKKWPGFTPEDYDTIVKALEECLTEDVPVLFVNALSDVKLISERQLNAIGLGRLPNKSANVPKSAHAKGN